MYFVKIIGLMLIILCHAAWGVSDDKFIRVATLDDYPPYCFPQEHVDGKMEVIPPGSDSASLQGYSWDIVRESFHEMGYTIRLRVYPWIRAMETVKRGMEDLLFPTGKTTEREKTFAYSQEPVNQVNFLVYVRPDSPLIWNGLDSLHGLTIGVIRGWNYGEAWDADKQIRKHNVNKILQGFRLLDAKRLDGLAGYDVVFDYTLKQAGWQTTYKKLPAFDMSNEYVVGLRTNSRISDILHDFDTGKRAIIQNGTFERILKKWQ